ncbi:MAG: ATP-grasp domain-containing protein [bacterium]|nr:ATP-grasp domain-containing protein [bacterium]
MTFPSSKITYITRDIERALGLPPTVTFQIVSNKTPIASEVCKEYPEFVFLMDSFTGTPLNTAGLMEHPDTTKLLPFGSSILVFKNNQQIEALAKKQGWNLLNPSAALAEQVENKMTQIEWLGDLTKYLPAHEITLVKDITWNEEPFILQWAHGHTGDSTLLIQVEKDLASLKQKFPERLTRKSAFIRGSSFTVNAVVAEDKILIANVSYQITGIEPFTENAFTTVGNDWALTHSLLDTHEVEYIETMVGDIGNKLRVSGWRGLFGVDIMRDEERNTIYLIEINARQPASTSFESFLQSENRLLGVAGLTTFEAHIKALLKEPITEKLILINDGAQIVQRVTSKTRSIKKNSIEKLGSDGYTVLSYINTEPNTDLLRIQSPRGIMESHTNFNERGKEITELLAGK